jgi:hypothetical protein
MDRGATLWLASDITQYSIGCNTVTASQVGKLLSIEAKIEKKTLG